MRQINPVQCTDQRFISSCVSLCVRAEPYTVCVAARPVYIPGCAYVMCVASPSSGLVQAMSEMIQGGAEGA